MVHGQVSMRDRVLYKYAQLLLERSMQAWDLILRHYDESIRTQLFEERQMVIDRADQLDQALESLIKRSNAATTSQALVVEMRRLRIRGLMFSSWLHASRRLLKVNTRRLASKAKIAGYEGSASLLSIEVQMSETNQQMFEVDELFRTNEELGEKPHKQFSRFDEFHSFVRALLMPMQLKISESAFRRVDRMYAKAMRELISTSTRKIYRLQALSLGVVLWRVVQPGVVLVVAGLAAAYLIHAILELAGIQFLHLNWLAVSAVGAAYAAERLFEHFFEGWHLKRYRKKCMSTGLALYAAEIRARVALLGFAIVSDAEPRAVSSTESDGSDGAMNEAQDPPR